MNFKLDVKEMSKFCVETIDRTYFGKFEGIQHIFHFPNGRGASVVKHHGSYGYEQDLWEIGYLAQVKEKDWALSAIPEIWESEVQGYLTDAMVYYELVKIKEYKS